MIFGKFIVYFLLFLVIFSYPSLKNNKSRSIVKLLTIPALLGVVMIFLTVMKVYFVYKFLMLVFVLVMVLLTYWQWGDKLRRWWK
ncbi:MAG: hypothetical protein P4L69_03405 [Desulfosporosinus sp.]|nr:hypothetical protein [Desulfosporosinus sp.]